MTDSTRKQLLSLTLYPKHDRLFRRAADAHVEGVLTALVQRALDEKLARLRYDDPATAEPLIEDLAPLEVIEDVRHLDEHVRGLIAFINALTMRLQVAGEPIDAELRQRLIDQTGELIRAVFQHPPGAPK